MKKNKVVLKIFFICLIGVVFTFCAYPFLLLFLKSITPEGPVDFKHYFKVMSHSGTLRAFKNTLLISGVIAILCSIISVPVGWLLVRTNLPMARNLRSWFCLPYAIPPYIGAIAWIYLANPSSGLLNEVFGLGLNIYSFAGLIWVETTFLYTFILLSVVTSLDRMDPSLEEAARLSGAKPYQVFWFISLPLLKKSILSGLILVILAAAASFGVPSLIGSPAKIYMVTTQIYTFQKMGSMSGLFQAASLSVYLLLFSLCLLLSFQWISRGSDYGVVSGKSSRLSRIDLGSWKWPLFFFLLALFSVLFILPVIGLIVTAFNQVQGTLIWSNFGLGNFRRVFFEMDETTRAMSHSLYLACVAASVACVVAIFLSYIKTKTKIKGRYLFEILASLPYSIPGTIVALALILSFSRGIFGIGPSLYNTFALLWIAYIIKYLNLALKTVGGGYGQIDNSLAEAAQISGASWWQTMRFIWLPLLKPSVIAAWFLIFMPAFSELTMTIMLSGPGLETLGTLIFQLQEYADPSGGASAVLALVVVSTVLLVNQIVKWMSKGQYGL